MYNKIKWMICIFAVLGMMPEVLACSSYLDCPTCSDTGNTYGGGQCIQCYFTCVGSVCTGSVFNCPYTPTDTCGGTVDNPSVTYYYCSANLCTSGVNSQSDSCTKGGVNCGTAHNWGCSGSPGTLSDSTSATTDSCNTNCVIQTYDCHGSDGGSVDDTCHDTGLWNSAANKTCYYGQDVSYPTYQCSTTVSVCADGSCSGQNRAPQCNGAGSCDTSAVAYYGVVSTIYPNDGYTLTGACAVTGTTYCGYSGWNGCLGTGSPYTCQKKEDNYRCTSATHLCTYDVGTDTTQNIASGSVCDAAYLPNDRAGSTTYYAFTGTSDRCTAPADPTTGFGDRLYDVYACNGANAQGPDVGDLMTDCGTGCCLDAGATTSCVATGSVASDFWNFGKGDSTSNDYCISAVVKDCNTNSDCITGAVCTYNSCVSPSGRFYVRNSADANESIWDQWGTILLRGALYQSTGTSPPAGSFQIQTGGGTPMAWITSSGNMYIKGTLNAFQGSITPAGNNDFQIMNSTGSVVALVDGGTGNLYTLSNVTQNTIT